MPPRGRAREHPEKAAKLQHPAEQPAQYQQRSQLEPQARRKRQRRGRVEGGPTVASPPSRLPQAQPPSIASLSAKYDTSAWFAAGTTAQVALGALSSETRCPICYGKLKHTRVSLVCGHRYCAECIDHCMRLEIAGRCGTTGARTRMLVRRRAGPGLAPAYTCTLARGRGCRFWPCTRMPRLHCS
uniref:RING-type domain-containing protein n=1 Tax=Chlamydomonas euryale TaxID=1486919 RepID=A0A6U2GPK9_9CHLO